MLRSINNNIWRGSNIALDSIFLQICWRRSKRTTGWGASLLSADSLVRAVTGGWRAGDSLDADRWLWSRAWRTWPGRGGCNPGLTSPRRPHWPGCKLGRGSHQPPGGLLGWDLRQKRGVTNVTYTHLSLVRDVTLSGLTHVSCRRHSLKVLLVLLRGWWCWKDGGLARACGQLRHEGTGHRVLHPARVTRSCCPVKMTRSCPGGAVLTRVLTRAPWGQGVGGVAVTGDGGRPPCAQQLAVTPWQQTTVSGAREELD